MRGIAPGERVSLAEPALELSIEGPHLVRLAGELGAMLIALDGSNRIPDQFRPLEIGARELRPGVDYGASGQLKLDLSDFPGSVERLLLVAFLNRGAGQGLSLRDFAALSASAGPYRLDLDLTNRGEAALIMLEIYRRSGAWRLCGNGQGFAGGLSALRSALNLDFPLPARVEAVPPAAGPSPWGGPPPRGSSFSGSGFAVDPTHIITNAHVIDGALKIQVASDHLSAPAELVFSDPRNDIALLRVERQLAGRARFRSGLDLHLGEDVIVLGFPLQGLLGSGPQATAGNISALCGIGNDTTVMQFSAPIASGNSGGPVLDQSGLVVGLVHASLNMDRVREEGSRAENVNFGVKGVTVRSFLSAAGIDAELSAEDRVRSRAEIVREARGYIYRIKCEA